MFDGFMKTMKIDKIIHKHMPVVGSNREHKVWAYIRPLSLMQYVGGRHIADLKEVRRAIASVNVKRAWASRNVFFLRF